MKRSFILFIFLFLLISDFYAQSVSFITMGDWGRGGNYGQTETAVAMGIYAEKNSTNFILVLGDNFYPTGVKSVNDSMWLASFENVYTFQSLQIPWYVAIGNHDYGGSVQAQIDYSNISSRWKLPARYYSFEKKIDDSTNVLFIITDTNPFIKSYLDINPENDELDSSSVEDLRKQDTKAQLNWIENVLKNSKAKWKIVSGHHPIYSGGLHGNTPELIEQFKPLFEKYNVNMYICGHDHDMQHLREQASSVNYFVAGSGSQLRPTAETANTLFAKSVNGFLAVNITTAEIISEFIDINGNELYKVNLK